MEQRPIPSDGRSYPLPAPDPNARPVEIVAIVEGWRLIAAASLVCAAMVAAYVLIRPPMYESKIQLLIDNETLELFRDEPSLVPALLSPSQLETQVKLIASEGLAREVVDKLDLASDPELTARGLLERIAPEDGDPQGRERRAVARFMQRSKVGSLGLSSVVEVGFTSRDRDKAARIVTALAQAYLDGLKQAASARGEGASAWVRDRLLAAGIRASVISDAAASVAPVGLRGAILVPAGTAAGLVLGVALAILRRLLDWQARTPAEIGSAIGTEVFGCLPALPAEPPSIVIAAAAASPTLAQVEASIEEWRHGRGMIVGIVAADENEGATTVATALARRLAEHGHGVLLVDANPADPAITRRHDLAGAPGLADVLRGAPYEEIAMGTDPDGFDVLPIGRIAAADPALLQLPAFAALAQRLRASYDHILLDIAPILGSAEVRASAGWIDGILLVASAPPQRRATLDQAMALMGRARERLLGVVVNRAAR